MPISETDRQIILDLRQASILEDVNPHRINCDGRNIVIMCGDGHQLIRKIRTHESYVKRDEHSECCCHGIMINGGALNLSPRFTRHMRLPVQKVLLSQIRQSMALKGVNTVALYVHAPCGAAKLRGMSVMDVLDELFKAKESLKRHFSKRRKFNVACFIQIDFGNGRERSYFISAKKWSEYKTQAAERQEAIS